MTQHELSTLLREHVARDEPPAPLPGPTLQAGRRRLRTRRVTEWAAALAVLAVAGASLVTWTQLDDGGRAATAMDPASAQALEDYDALRMPALMDEQVRGVLERTAPELGESRFAAYDDQRRDLPERYWSKASALEVSYGPDEHRYSVSISHARSEAEGDPEAYCRDGLDGGYYLECTVSRTDDGDVVISMLEATRPMWGGRSHMVVQRKDLDTVDVDRLWFSRTVKVIKSETLLTYVTERVKATDPDPGSVPFTTPYADLAAIGTDPLLVMPVPPPGDNGCPAWSMPRPRHSVSCGSTAD
ncbi:hypothetical protein KM427_14800 [Nocardioides sp. LMS-CY]|uniref:hypothetical protein n=1 Tax=Nocardioides sp. (strain LMS-CY) TaxID=2840457 RepID=UPI001BFFF373|nr:hypothetical protein [Nocardioides sp. LMS-CY]QWF20260.1 hypothetical protein KM427_14800 [Nocardioides sp. LMS-CY]